MRILKTLLTNLHYQILICGGFRERVFYGIGRRGSCGNAALNFVSVNLECPSLVPPLSVRDGRRTISGHLVSNICPPICGRGRSGGAGCFRGMQTTRAVSGFSASDRPCRLDRQPLSKMVDRTISLSYKLQYLAYRDRLKGGWGI